MSTRYGYIRVSSSDQNEDRQVRALAAQDIDSAHIYMDKLSGKDSSRKKNFSNSTKTVLSKSLFRAAGRTISLLYAMIVPCQDN